MSEEGVKDSEVDGHGEQLVTVLDAGGAPDGDPVRILGGSIG